jgi:hypothetical protein
VTVSVRIPILIPGLVVDDQHLVATRDATLPNTGGVT